MVQDRAISAEERSIGYWGRSEGERSTDIALKNRGTARLRSPAGHTIDPGVINPGVINHGVIDHSAIHRGVTLDQL